MIFEKFTTLGTLMALVFVLLFSLSAEAQIYFSDDFENPAVSQNNWEVITGDWRVADGVYHQLSTASPWQVSMVAADKWNNQWEEYTIDFMVKPLTTGDAPVNVLFRVQDPVPAVWADRTGPNTHMYRWIVNGWTNTESRVYMYNAGASVMLTQTNNSLVVGDWYHIKLVVTKTGFAGYVNDVQMFDTQHAQWTTGRVGLHAYSGMMDFDNFVVYGRGGGGFPYASLPDPPDGALHPDTWVNLGWRAGDFAVSHDVYLGENAQDVNDATRASEIFRGNQTATSYMAGFPGYAYPEGLVPGTTYYWRIDEVNDAEPNSPWKGSLWSFSIPPNTAYNPNPADGAEFVGPDNVTLTWTPGFGAKLHHVYLGTNLADVEAGAPGTYKGPAGIAKFGPAKLESEKVYYWRIDEFDGATTYKGNIWAFTTPGAAGSPQPANGAVDVPMTAKLSWTPATNATSHDVYFGTDKDAVKNATTASAEFKGSKAKGSETYDPGKLAWNGSYYWRVDAVYSTGMVKGLVWSFTIADFISVDDFESYNDLDPPDPASDRIFDKWIDGFATPTTNGALVGNDMPPYAERTVVHSGAQSMPYRYDNTNKTSEATLMLVYPRDWTEEGVTKLSLWYRGASANAAEKMYVALNGGTPVYNADPKAAQAGGWTEWVIDLQAFQGVTLTNVNTISIGFGTKGSPAAGGTGKMYFDDIRLVRP